MKEKPEGRIKLYNPSDIYLSLVVLAVARKSQRGGQAKTWRKPDKGRARITILGLVLASLGKQNFLKIRERIVKRSCSGNKTKLGRNPE